MWGDKERWERDEEIERERGQRGREREGAYS